MRNRGLLPLVVSTEFVPPASLPHSPHRETIASGMKFLFEFVSCCGSPRKEGERIRAAAEEWKPSLCAISEDVVVVTVERVGGGETKKKATADPAPEPERSASRKRSGGSYARVHDRGFNGDEYDQRRASFQAVIPAFSPAPFMF
ncbi:uncharacterized protein LOC104426796 isoform X2 [Eucalyptus grandis]|uniref:uncharacterized protein LOC104426796 isoform X2 n=1 Tax=Eucalyptus grandis TaxID=71139 RepID=UPI00192EC194|nr:uncharacterized protein LOC104426796 isoform X2 [Eucalyptus grandis]